jgi:hypothetical protein
MKSEHGLSLCFAGIIVVLALAVVFTGCTQPSQAPAVTAPTTGQASPAPVQPAGTSLVPASLPYGVTISVPGDWEKHDVLTTGVRDYGKDTLNIANFFSPDEIAGDTQSYNSLSIDVDQNFQGDFTGYFNNATLALEDAYGHPTPINAQTYAMKISGYDTEELSFVSNTVKGTYLFANAGGTMYIFSFKSPITKRPAVDAFSAEVPGIITSIQLTPPGLAVQKHR